MTVDLPAELVARLRAEAARRGVSVDEVIADFAARLPSGEPAREHTLSFIGLGASRPNRADGSSARAGGADREALRPRGSERPGVLLVDTNVILAVADLSAVEHDRSARLLDEHHDLTVTARVP